MQSGKRKATMGSKGRTLLHFLLIGIVLAGCRMRQNSPRHYDPLDQNEFDSFGSVVDKNDKLLPNVTLLFCDRTGGSVVYSIKCDAQGSFRTHGLTRFDTLPVDGFALVKAVAVWGLGLADGKIGNRRDDCDLNAIRDPAPAMLKGPQSGRVLLRNEVIGDKKNTHSRSEHFRPNRRIQARFSIEQQRPER